MLNEKSEDFVSYADFYVFVALGGLLERSSYHVVPSRDVAAYTSTEHRQWCCRQDAPDISMLTTYYINFNLATNIFKLYFLNMTEVMTDQRSVRIER